MLGQDFADGTFVNSAEIFKEVGLVGGAYS